MKTINMQSGGIKTKLILHIEKIVFAMALILVGWFIYSGMLIPPIDTTPEEVSKAAKNAKKNIDDSSWSNVQEERAKTEDFEAKAKAATLDVARGPLQPPAIFNPQLYESITPRSDPKLLTVADLEVNSYFAPFAILDKAKALSSGSGYDEYSGTAGYSPSTEYYADEYGLDGASDPDAPPTLTPEQQKKFGPARATAGSKVEGKHFVVITGLVPLKKQLELYEVAFQNAAGYNPQRDFPNYIFYEVQRCEQKPDGTWSDWAKIANTNTVLNQARQWSSPLEKIASVEYVSPVLTSPIPPILMRDPGIGGLHSKVPAYSPMDELADNELLEETDPEALPEEQKVLQELPGALPGLLNRDEDGYDSGYSPRTSTNRAYNRGSRGTSRGYGSGGYGSGYGSGYADESGYGMAAGAYDSEYKMFRFYDTKVVANKSYRYRVQLWLEDPNHPARVEAEPDSRALDADVLERINVQVKKEEEEITKKSGMHYRVSWRKTEFSDPTEPVLVKSDSSVLAGQITAGRKVVQSSTNKNILAIKEPTAQVLGMSWDENLKALVTKEVTKVSRGQNVTTKDDTWVLDPGTMQFKKEEDYAMNTETMILDMHGGEDLPGRYQDENKARLKSPGEVLLIDSSGNIKLRNELDDKENFSVFNFAKPEVKKKSKKEEDEYGEEYDLGDYYGEEESPRSRRRR